MARWTTNIEKGRIKIEIIEKHYQAVCEQMQAGVDRLHFGFATEDDNYMPGKNKGKGKGKKGKLRFGLPTDPEAFRRMPSILRDGLGNLTFSRYPFRIAVRKLKEDGKGDKGNHTQHRDQEASSSQGRDRNSSHTVKRYSEDDVRASKRRSPTPRRMDHSATPMYSQAEPAGFKQQEGRPPIPDASAAAAAAAAAANTSTISMASASRPDLLQGTFSA